MNIDDPKLTAFALDELDEPERSTIAREVAESPETQRMVDETRELARLLKNEFAAELSEEARPRRNLSDIRDDPWLWLRARPLAIAAGIAIFAILSAVVIATYNLRSDSRASETANYAVIEAEPNPDQAAAELAVPDRITTPWRSEAIRRIERVVIGEIELGSENGDLRVLEIIKDGYRVERLKQRLASPVLLKKSEPGNAGRAYALMFLDHNGYIIAGAAFYSLPKFGFALEPLKNARGHNGRYFIGGGALLPGDWKTNVDYRAYALPFPDWDDCVGYAPGA